MQSDKTMVVEGPTSKPAARADGGQPAGATSLSSNGPSLAGPFDWTVGISLSALVVSFLWAYWPTLRYLVAAWESEPDYSHGYLIVPLAALFLWLRRATFPGLRPQASWLGLSLILASIGARYLSASYYAEPIDGWSIVLWTAGAACILGGRNLLWWSLPAMGFLRFMVPLPFRAERWLSLPLQTVATNASTYALQLLGQPALAEGIVIWIGDKPLEVAEACSGLRIFVGIVALAYACAVLTDRPWWERCLVVLSALPVAVLANALRIVVTALLLQHASTESAAKFTHDGAGFLMIPLAASIFMAFLWYLSKLFRRVEVIDARRLVPRGA